jgi:hypothetical protein
MEKKFRLLLLLALLMTAATGAWAQEPATTYSVKMKDGTVDAKNWSIASGEKSAKGDAAAAEATPALSITSPSDR